MNPPQLKPICYNCFWWICGECRSYTTDNSCPNYEKQMKPDDTCDFWQSLYTYDEWDEENDCPDAIRNYSVEHLKVRDEYVKALIESRALEIVCDYIDRSCPFVDLNVHVYPDCAKRFEERSALCNRNKCWMEYCRQEARRELPADLRREGETK